MISGAVPWAGLEYRHGGRRCRRGRHAHAPISPGGHVGENVANMFSITITSKSQGRFTKQRGQAST